MTVSRGHQFSDEELWELVTKNKEFLTSVGEWNQYAKTNKLPHSQTLIKRLGKWNEIKRRLNIERNEQHRPIKYSKEELIELLKQHKNAFKNIYEWNQYAKRNKLPDYNIFRRYLGDKMIMELTGYSFGNYTKDQIKEIILHYFPFSAPTVGEWQAVGREENIPSASTIIRVFGSWNEMKKQVYSDK